MKREVDLYAAKVDSQQVYDTQKALVDQLAAAVQADQAGIDSAQVNLNYTTVTSPIEGRTGIRQVDQGNIVHAADTGGLVVLTQLKPISVVFTLPEQDLEDIHKEMAASGQALKVLAVGRDNSTLLGEGILAVIDNEIDPSTATLRLKANFPNENLGLWPGQFVNTRLQLTTRKDALVVPAAAIQRGPDGAYVFVITNAKGGKGSAGKHPDGSATAEAGPKSRPAAGATTPPGKPGDSANQEILSVKIQPVTVAAQIEAGEALVESGLKKGDRIVVDGQYKLQDGSQVKISPAKAAKVDSGPEDGIQ
jgi:multidrug efflux system membrane fusion protein